MPELRTDDPLLFATWAVSLGFVTPQDVSRAMEAIATGPALSLADRLEQTGSLTGQQRLAVETKIRQESGLTDEQSTWPTRSAAPSASNGVVLEASEATVKEVSLPVSRPDGIDDLIDAPTQAKIKPPDSEACPPVDDATQDIRQQQAKRIIAHGAKSLEAPDDSVRIAPSGPGRYSIRGLHAKGGQGRILLAFDEQIGREVAIKEFLQDPQDGKWAAIPSSQHATSGGQLRFIREARVTGQLEHPNIVTVHDLGRYNDGTPYYSMRFVRGETLARKLRQSKNLGERMKLLAAVWDLCNAIAFAHSRGVVHRDIKPHNVMVGEFGETVVLDWGLAKPAGKPDIRADEMERAWKLLHEGCSEETAVGTTLGTPSYMSPEQAAGNIQQIDHLSDVWGLGAVLYQVLTGLPPFKGKTPVETIHLLETEPVKKVQSLCPDAPSELAAIAEKALQKTRELRYQSAKEMANDIGSYMTGGRVRAYEYSSWDLLKRFARQNKPAIVASGLVLATVIATLITLSLSWRAERSARQVANFHLAEAYAEKADRLMEEIRYPSAAVMASAALVHNPAHPLSPYHASDFIQRFPHSLQRWIESASKIYRIQHSPTAVLTRNVLLSATPSRITYAPDGQQLAAAFLDGTVQLFPLSQLDHPRVLRGHTDEVYSLAYSPDGHSLASGGQDKLIRVWDTRSGVTRLILKGHSDLVRDLNFSPDGRLLASAGWDGQVILWDPATGQEIRRLKQPERRIFAVRFSPGGRFLATGDNEPNAVLWDPQTGERLVTFSGHEGPIRDVVFSPDGRRLAMASLGEAEAISIWDLDTRKRLHLLAGHREGVLALSFSPDGHRLFSAGYDHTFRVWDVESGTTLINVGAHDDLLYTLSLSPDGTVLATAGFDRRLRFWRLELDRNIRTIRGATKGIQSVVLNHNGSRVVGGCWDEYIYVWDFKTGNLLRKIKAHEKGIEQVIYGTGERWLASGGHDRAVRIWNAATGKLIKEMLDHKGVVYDLDLSPDEKVLASASGDFTIRLWNTSDFSLLRTISGHSDEVLNVKFSPDGRQLASVGFDGTARLWDPQTGGQLRQFQCSDSWMTGLDFSPDGKLLATSGKSGKITLWDLQSGQVWRTLAEHTQWVDSVQFSPDGRMLISISYDGQVRIWSIDTGQTLLIISLDKVVVAASFTPDGKAIVVADEKDLQVYPLDFSALQVDPQRLLKQAERQAGLKLTGYEARPADLNGTTDDSGD